MGLAVAQARAARRAVIAGGRGAAHDLGVISVARVDEASQRGFFRWRLGVGESFFCDFDVDKYRELGTLLS